MMDSDKPKRKPTRWRRFDYSQNRAYFITICTKDKKCILSSIVPNDNSVAQTENFDQTVGDGAPRRPDAARRFYAHGQIDAYRGNC